MKAFIEGPAYWNEITDKNAILDAKDCVFADTPEEAIDYINTHYNDIGPEFEIVKMGNNWSRDKHKIMKMSPRLKRNTPHERVIELIKQQTINVEQGAKFAKYLEEKVGDLLELGIIRSWDTFEYNPEKAKIELKKLKRKLPKPKKGFIKIDKIYRTNYAMMNKICSRIQTPSTYINMENRYSQARKHQACEILLELVKLFTSLFGKYSHRHVTAFQDFKAIWKKEKPKSARLTGITQELFDFMEEEIKKRKPRKKKSSLNKKP